MTRIFLTRNAKLKLAALFFSVLFAFSAVQSPAAGVTNCIVFNLSSWTGAANAQNRDVLITPLSITPPAGTTATYDPFPTNTGSGGTFTLTNVYQGTYLIQVQAPPRPFTFRILAPDFSGSTNADMIMVADSKSTWPPSTVAYAASTSDARYAPIGSVGSGGTSTNVTGTLTNSIITPNVTGSGNTSLPITLQTGGANGGAGAGDITLHTGAQSGGGANINLILGNSGKSLVVDPTVGVTATGINFIGGLTGNADTATLAANSTLAGGYTPTAIVAMAPASFTTPAQTATASSTNNSSILPLSAPGGSGSFNAGSLTNFPRELKPEEFGAVGDAVTDDSAAFQACLLAAARRASISNSSGAVIVKINPLKSYYLNNANIRFAYVGGQNGYIIQGTLGSTPASQQTNIIFNLASGNAFWETNDQFSGITFKNVSIRNRAAGNTANGILLDASIIGNGLHFVESAIKGFGGTAILCTNYGLSDITFSDISGNKNSGKFMTRTDSRHVGGGGVNFSMSIDHSFVGGYNGGNEDSDIGLEIDSGFWTISHTEFNGTNHAVVMHGGSVTMQKDNIEHQPLNVANYTTNSSFPIVLDGPSGTLTIDGGRCVNFGTKSIPAVIISGPTTSTHGQVKLMNSPVLATGSNSITSFVEYSLSVGTVSTLTGFSSVASVTNVIQSISYSPTVIDTRVSGYSGLSADKENKGGLLKYLNGGGSPDSLVFLQQYNSTIFRKVDLANNNVLVGDGGTGALGPALYLVNKNGGIGVGNTIRSSGYNSDLTTGGGGQSFGEVDLGSYHSGSYRGQVRLRPNSNSGDLTFIDGLIADGNGDTWIYRNLNVAGTMTGNGSGITNQFNLQATNYVAANFIPTAGFAKIVQSNGFWYSVTQFKTNLVINGN